MGQGLILQTGIHWTRSKGKPGGPPPEPTFTFYVDSINGSDTNPGTQDEPFASVTPIVWADGVTVGIARGTYLRQQIDVGAYSNIQIRAYGDPELPLPVFDCSDIVEIEWIQPDSVTYPNLWAMSSFVDVDDDLYTMYPSVWFDGVRPMFSVDPAPVYDTLGLWWTQPAESEFTRTMSIAVNTDVDPNTQLVEIASRWFGVALGPNSYMEGIRTKRNLHNNGSASLAENSEAKDCIFEDGVKHNAYFGRNSRYTNCVGYKSDWPTRDNHSFFVGHALDGSSATSSVVGCLAYGEIEKIEWAQANNMGISGFMWHTSGVDGEQWQTVQVNHSTAKNCNVGFEATDTVSVNSVECWSDGCFKGIKYISDYAYTQELKVTENDGIRMNRGFELNTAVTGLHNRARFYSPQGAADGFVYSYATTGNTTFQNSVFYRDTGVGGNYNYMVRNLNAGHSIRIERSIMYDPQFSGSESCFLSTPADPAGYTLDTNYFGGSENMDWELSGNNFFNYADVLADPDSGPRFTNNVQDVPSSVQDAANGLFYSVLGGTADSMGAGINYYIDVGVTYQPILTYSELDAL